MQRGYACIDMHAAYGGALPGLSEYIAVHERSARVDRIRCRVLGGLGGTDTLAHRVQHPHTSPKADVTSCSQLVLLKKCLRLRL